MTTVCSRCVEELVARISADKRDELVINDDNLSALLECCAVIDAVIDKYNGRDVSSEVREECGNLIQVRFVIDDLVFDNNKNPFYKMMDNVAACKFAYCKGPALCVVLAFPSVWDGVN